MCAASGTSTCIFHRCALNIIYHSILIKHAITCFMRSHVMYEKWSSMKFFEIHAYISLPHTTASSIRWQFIGTHRLQYAWVSVPTDTRMVFIAISLPVYALNCWISTESVSFHGTKAWKIKVPYVVITKTVQWSTPPQRHRSPDRTK